MKHVRRSLQKIGSRREKGAQQGGAGDQNPISTSPPPLPTSPIPTLPTGLLVPSQHARPSDPQSLNDLAATTLAIPPSTPPTVSAPPSTSKSPDIWKLAFDKFREDEPTLVPGYDKHVLGDAADSADLSHEESVEAAVKTLLEDREKKQWKIHLPGHDIKIRKQIERLVKILQWSDPLVKDAVSSQPYAALAWSGVSLLLPLLASSTTQNEAMLDGYNSIGELQEFWKTSQESSLQSEHQQHYHSLIKPLVELYSLFFAYQAHVICHLSKAQLSRAWKDVSDPQFWTNKLDKINKSSENCGKLIGVSRDKEVQENRDRQLQELQKMRTIQENILQNNKEDRRDGKETRLLQDLAVAAGDYKRYKSLNPERVRGTCEWFLMDERFCKWRDNASSSLLWVSALPGCGKSVLSKSLIDEGQLDITTITITPSSNEPSTSSQSTVCYFFYKDGGEGNMDSAHALCALLHQLFTWPSTSGLIKYALQRHREHGETLTRKFSELWRILLDCVTSPDAGEIICVFDALDECKEDSRQEFIKALNEFYSQSERPSTASSNLKFLVTSRPYPDLDESFQKFRTTTAYLRFDGNEKSEQIRQEIDLVIDARLQDITEGFTTEDQQKISKRLKSMDNRTYLWLHLTLNIIEKRPVEFGKRSDIEKLLSHLPSQVSDAYEKILSRSEDRRTRILLQIMLASARPLTLDEANFALTLAILEQEPASHAEIESELWPKDRFENIVTNLCGLFVSVYDYKLSFIHQTAREFLTDPKPEGNWKGHFNMPQSHGIMSRICLFYLLLPDIDRPPANDPAQDKKYPYLAYAANFWPLHFISQEAANANAFRKHARTLCNTTEHQASIWAPSYLEQRNLNREGWSDLALASYLGINEVVQDILFKEKPDIHLETVNEDGSTPLLLAARQGHEAVVKLLLEKGAEIEAKDKYDHTPLLWAAGLGHEAVVKLLLEKGAEIEVKDKDGSTPLLRAATRGRKAVVKLLLEKGAKIEAKYIGGSTLLLFAAGQGHEAIVKLLLEKGANIEAKDKGGSTSLLLAASRGREAVVKLLVEKGARIEAKDDNGTTPLFQAARIGHEAVVKLLLEKGAEIEAKDKRGSTPLLQAAWRGHDAVVKLLLEKGPKIEAKNIGGLTPLLQASGQGQEAVVKLLLEKGAEIEAKDKGGSTPLLLAARQGNRAVVKLLLEKGAKIEVENDHGTTPLFQAVRIGHEAVVKLLLEKGAEIEAKDKRGSTPLLLAARQGNRAVVKLLLEKGAKIEAKDEWGCTLLFWAAMQGHEAVVKLLLEKGVEMEVKDEYGRTPLLVAVKKGHKGIVKLLLEKGVEIEVKDMLGHTPLLEAVKQGNEAVIKLLLEGSRDRGKR